MSPKAARNAIQGWHGDRLKVSVTAVPERGKANEAVVELIAEALDLAPSRVEVVAGHTQSNKRLRIIGLSLEAALACLPPRA